MTETQIYILFSLGCIFALAILIFGNWLVKWHVTRSLKLLLTVKILLSFAAIIILPFSRPGFSGKIPFPAVRRSSTAIGIFFLGIFLTVLLVSWLRKSRQTDLSILLSSQSTNFDRLFRWAMAPIFIWSGIVKWFYPQIDAHFFFISGYNADFLTFITAIEILGGFGLLFRTTALYASAILIANMAGATYTHYHNYFFRNAPGPFSNSIPSLSLQPYLITILVIAISAIRQNKATGQNKEIGQNKAIKQNKGIKQKNESDLTSKNLSEDISTSHTND